MLLDRLGSLARPFVHEKKAVPSSNLYIMNEFRNLDKLGQGFTSTDPLAEVDIGDGSTLRPTFVNKNLKSVSSNKVIGLLQEDANSFAWSYIEMPKLSRELVEQRLPIKPSLGCSNKGKYLLVWICIQGSRTKFTSY